MPKLRTTIHGFGINDYTGSTSIAGVHLKSYSVWKDMIRRCYAPQNNRTTWTDCIICDEWRSFNTFKQWFDENYVENYSLDKDILGNSLIYSPDTCRFVPKHINSLLASSKCSGVYYVNRDRCYRAQLSKFGKHYNLGSFETEDEARLVYVEAKCKHIADVALESFLNNEIKSDILLALRKKGNGV